MSDQKEYETLIPVSEILEIQKLAKGGASVEKLAEEFNVTRGYVIGLVKSAFKGG